MEQTIRPKSGIYSPIGCKLQQILPHSKEERIIERQQLVKTIWNNSYIIVQKVLEVKEGMVSSTNPVHALFYATNFVAYAVAKHLVWVSQLCRCAAMRSCF